MLVWLISERPWRPAAAETRLSTAERARTTKVLPRYHFSGEIPASLRELRTVAAASPSGVVRHGVTGLQVSGRLGGGPLWGG